MSDRPAGFRRLPAQAPAQPRKNIRQLTPQQYQSISSIAGRVPHSFRPLPVPAYKNIADLVAEHSTSTPRRPTLFPNPADENRQIGLPLPSTWPDMELDRDWLDPDAARDRESVGTMEDHLDNVGRPPQMSSTPILQDKDNGNTLIHDDVEQDHDMDAGILEFEEMNCDEDRFQNSRQGSQHRNLSPTVTEVDDEDDLIGAAGGQYNDIDEFNSVLEDIGMQVDDEAIHAPSWLGRSGRDREARQSPTLPNGAPTAVDRDPRLVASQPDPPTTHAESAGINSNIASTGASNAQGHPHCCTSTGPSNRHTSVPESSPEPAPGPHSRPPAPSPARVTSTKTPTPVAPTPIPESPRAQSSTSVPDASPDSSQQDAPEAPLDEAPITVEELISDELLYRALEPILPSTKRRLSPDPPAGRSDPPTRTPTPGRKSSTPPRKRHKDIKKAKGPNKMPLPYPGHDDDPPRDSPGDSGSDDSDSARYRHPRNNLTLQQFATLAHRYIERKHNFTVACQADLRDFEEGMIKRRATLKKLSRRAAKEGGMRYLEQHADHEAMMMDEEILDRVIDIAHDEKYEMHALKIRRARPLIYEATGIKVDLIDRCRRGCRAFTSPTDIVCQFCGEDRYKADGVTPAATYPYIKILPRLRLWFSDPEFLEMMCSYRREAEKEKKELTDYWNCGDFKTKKKDGLFKDKHQRDLALFLTTDELTPYKSRAYYRITPMLLICYNIPPHLRTKMRYLLVTGFIPGRRNTEDCVDGTAKPGDRESFFEPLIKELEKLRDGVDCFDSLNKADFVLRAFLVLIGADMVERVDLLCFFGHKGKSFCEYCRSTGLKHGGVYTPTTAPTNAGPNIRAREERLRQQRKAYFNFTPEYDNRRRHQLHSFARTPAHIQRCLDYIDEYPDDIEFQALHGIKRKSIFSRLSATVSIPFSFPPDIMHLACNVGKLMVEIYSGSIFQRKRPTDSADTKGKKNGKTTDGGSRNRPAAVPGGPMEDSDYESMGEGDADSQAEEDDPLEEPFIIPKQAWEKIGTQQESSKATFPTSMGEIDDISRYLATMTSASWFSWILNQSLPYFYDHLPAVHFEGYSKFVKAVQLCYRKRLYKNEVNQIETLINEFVDYFEEHIYKKDIRRLHVWKPVVHQLLHVAEAIRRFGPMYLYSQWTIERYHQRIKKILDKGRSKPNEHLTNVICEWQCLNALGFVLPLVNGSTAGMKLNSLEGDAYTDDYGNLKISKLFRDAIVLDETKVTEQLEEDGMVEEPDRFVRNDRAWFPHDLEALLPRRRRHPPLPLPTVGSDWDESGSSSGSDTDAEAAEAAGDAFEQINTDRLLKSRIMTGCFSEITTLHKNFIIRKLRGWNWISDAFRGQSFEVQKQLLVDGEGLLAKKWRTMIMVRQVAGLGFTPPFVKVRVTGAESPHWARTRSNAWIYYRGEDGDKRYGRVLYFLSMLDPRHWPFTAPDQDGFIELDEEGLPIPPPDRPDLHFAVVERHKPIKAKSLLRIPQKTPKITLDLIDTAAIEDEVGLVQCNKFQYLVSRTDGCLLADLG